MNLMVQNSLRSDFHSQNRSIGKGKYNYIAVDSQNEEEYEKKRIWGSVESSKFSSSIEKHRKNSYKSGSDCFNFCQENIYERDLIDAQLKVQSLKKQCALLEKMINQMIKQQTELLVDEKKRERSKSLKKQQAHQKYCPLHNKKKSHIMIKEDIDEIINFKLSDISVLDNKILPLQSKQIKNKMTLERNVAQIKYKPAAKMKERKSKINQQNQTPVKMKRKVSQNSKSTYKNPNFSNSKILPSKINRC